MKKCSLKESIIAVVALFLGCLANAQTVDKYLRRVEPIPTRSMVTRADWARQIRENALRSKTQQNAWLETLLSDSASGQFRPRADRQVRTELAHILVDEYFASPCVSDDPRRPSGLDASLSLVRDVLLAELGAAGADISKRVQDSHRHLSKLCPTDIHVVQSFIDELVIDLGDIRGELDRRKKELAVRDRLTAEQAEKSRAQRAQDLKSGRAPISTASDAMLSSGAQDGTVNVVRPKIHADGLAYALPFGALDRVEAGGTLYVVKWGEYYYALKADSKTKFQDGFRDSLRLGSALAGVGIYSSNVTYLTVGGSQRTMPIFSAIYVGSQ